MGCGVNLACLYRYTPHLHRFIYERFSSIYFLSRLIYLMVKCFLITGSIGPCPPGHQFIVPHSNSISASHSSKKYAECVCKDGHVKWFGDGACYRPYTRGPCSPGFIYSVNVTVGSFSKSKIISLRPNFTILS